MDIVEFVARYIAARKMGLLKDLYGLKLPITLWRQQEHQARELLKLHSEDELLKIIDLTIKPGGPLT